MDIVDLDMGQLVYLGQAAFAMVLGGLIGWERDRSGKPAGLRTHMLVAGSASLLVSLSHIGIGVFAAQLGRPVAGGDPIRVVQTIITGFSVVGAGAIIGARGQVLGLTTATSILFVAAIGISVGLGQVLLAAGATVLGLVVLRLLGALERRYWGDTDPPGDP